jgi:hypothetical protein
MLIKRPAITVKANSRMVNVGLYCSSAGITRRILSMAGRLNLLLARKAEDPEAKGVRVGGHHGEADAYDPDT